MYLLGTACRAVPRPIDPETIFATTNNAFPIANKTPLPLLVLLVVLAIFGLLVAANPYPQNTYNNPSKNIFLKY
jgi:hypothetical protein